MSVNKEYKNIINRQYTSKSFNNKNIVKDKVTEVKDKIIYNTSFKNQTIEDQFRRNRSFLSSDKYESDSSNNTKSISLKNYFQVSEAMGLDSHTLYEIKYLRKTFLNPEEYEKIKQFFQKHLSPNSTHYLEPFDPKLVNSRGKLKIDESLLQTIIRGVDEIIENKTHINHPETPDSNNNKRCINVTNEENPLDRIAVEHLSKKVKVTATKRLPSAFYQGAIPVHQSLFLKEAFQSTNEATTTSSIEDKTTSECQLSAQQQNVDDLFYTIPDELFLPEEPSLSSTNQASSAPLLLDDLFLTSSIADDAFPLENTWDDK